MAIQITAFDDSIRLEKAFVSGKDRIHVNGDLVFEGKLATGQPQTFTVHGRDYTIEKRSLGGMGAFGFHITIQENGQPVGSGLFNQLGKPVENEAQAKAASALNVCAMIGGAIGVAVMLTLNKTTGGAVPGGAIGGAIGGGVGGGLGFCLGALLFGLPSK